MRQVIILVKCTAWPKSMAREEGTDVHDSFTFNPAHHHAPVIQEDYLEDSELMRLGLGQSGADGHEDFNYP